VHEGRQVRVVEKAFVVGYGLPIRSCRKHCTPPVKCGMKLRPSSPLEFARPVGYRLDFDISSSATLWAQAQETTTHRARTSSPACVVRSMKRTPVTLFSSEIITSRTIELGTISSFPVLSAGRM